MKLQIPVPIEFGNIGGRGETCLVLPFDPRCGSQSHNINFPIIGDTEVNKKNHPTYEDFTMPMKLQNVKVNIRLNRETTNETCIAYVINQLHNNKLRNDIWNIHHRAEIDHFIVALSDLLTYSMVGRHIEDGSGGRPTGEHPSIKPKSSPNEQEVNTPPDFNDIRWQLFAISIVKIFIGQLPNLMEWKEKANGYLDELRDHKHKQFLTEQKEMVENELRENEIPRSEQEPK